MSGITVDDQSDLVQKQYAVVFTPRRQRNRFPENCVEVCADEAAARAGADPARGRHAALVYGPSRSSEGFRLYYLVHWLED